MLGAFKRHVIAIKAPSYLPVSSTGISRELTHGEKEGVRSLSSNVNYTRQTTYNRRAPRRVHFFVFALVFHCHTAK